MKNKHFSMVLVPLLVIGLVGCNYDNDKNNALDINKTNNRTLRVRDNLMNNRDPFYKGNDMNLNGKNIDNRLNISSMHTDLSSKNYPHTRAILTQDAKYNYVPMNSNEDVNGQEESPLLNQGPFEQYQGGAPVPNQFQPEVPMQQPGQFQPLTPGALPEQTPEQPKAPATERQGETPSSINQAAQQVIDITNAQRKQNGLPALKTDPQLSGVAQKKSQDMQQNHYFSHTSPTYGSPFDMMRDFGVTYRSAGENIAQGQSTPREVVQAWMNSEGHRKNILSPNYTHIGVGYDQNGNHWTQMFIGK